MEVYVERTEQTLKLKFKGTVLELLDKLEISPEDAMVVRDEDLLTLDDEVYTTDTLRILSVISGG
ncbi:MAG: MoaD/ThiS family protein [Candidatus Woesearchaeota archaeon]|jgi:sulfur carrier protein ThiS